MNFVKEGVLRAVACLPYILPMMDSLAYGWEILKNSSPTQIFYIKSPKIWRLRISAAACSSKRCPYWRLSSWNSQKIISLPRFTKQSLQRFDFWEFLQPLPLSKGAPIGGYLHEAAPAFYRSCPGFPCECIIDYTVKYIWRCSKIELTIY